MAKTQFEIFFSEKKYFYKLPIKLIEWSAYEINVKKSARNDDKLIELSVEGSEKFVKPCELFSFQRLQHFFATT